ncbi:MspI family type II restriction endonuclease [Peribacillus sp. Hz7]|uniref:MspI family type II restriction endonuclease n=1 Tax=Peribacillus sp. Hz7 TaxID=3344873 RepID=UPI0035CA08E6
MDSKLVKLYTDYGIKENAAPGTVGDKLGDVYEDYCISIFKNEDYLKALKQGHSSYNNEDGYKIYISLLHKVNIYSVKEKIKEIHATKNIPPRATGGNPKTDVLISIYLEEQKILVPISIKQSTLPKVAFAEFDTTTIVNEIGIKDKTLIQLLTKHQNDASAKHFTPNEKKELSDLLEPIKEKFVRWVVTGSAQENTSDIRFPKYLIKFDLMKQTFSLKASHVYSIEEYIHNTLYKNGQPKKGGFGTGLSWTYATGTKGQKIQFKG